MRPTVRFSCPECDATLESPLERCGQLIVCPRCQEGAQVPEPPRGHAVSVEPLADNPGRLKAHRGPLIVTLGIMGFLTMFVFVHVAFVIFLPVAIAAALMGQRDLEAMKQGRMDPEGKSMTATGHILGRVATLVGAIVVGLFVVALLMLGTG